MHNNTADPFMATELPEQKQCAPAGIHDAFKPALLSGHSSGTLAIMLEAAHAGCWEWEITSGMLKGNSRWAATIGYCLEELGGMSMEFWKKRCHPDDLAVLERKIAEHLADRTEWYEQELRVRHKNGNWIWVLDRGKVCERDHHGNPVRMAGAHQDISGRKETEAAIDSIRNFEILATTLSNRFINLPYDEIDRMIDSTLQLIGEHVHADRCYVFQFHDNLCLMDNTHEWCAPEIEPQIELLKNLPTEHFPWWMERIHNNQLICIPRVSDMPEEAGSEREILQSQKIRSLIVVPLTSGTIPFGYIGFDAVKQEQVWLPDTVATLKLVGGIIANALQRKHAEQFIHAEFDLAVRLNSSSSLQETLKACLQASLVVSGMDCGGIYLVDHTGNSVSLAYHEGLPKHFVSHASFYPLDSDHGRLILQAKPVYRHFNDINIVHDKEILEERLKAMAIVPVTHHGEAIACLNIASHSLSQVPEFARKGIETLSAHIGAAIIHAQQENEIAETKSNFETLFDTINDFLFIVDINGRLVHTNAAVEKQLGYSNEALRQMHVLDMHPEELRQKAQANFEQMIAGTIFSCSVPLQTCTGNLIPVDTRVTLGVWNKQPVFFGISRDISERILSEQALVESETRFRELTDLLPLPLFEVDTHLDIIYANHKSLEVFGSFTLRKGLNPSILKFCIPEQRNLLLSDLTSMKTGTDISTCKEYTAVKKNGIPFPALLYSMPIVQGGEFSGARGIVVDLTELKMAEEALRNSAMQKKIAEEFKTLIENIPGAVYRINSSGKTTILSMVSEFLQEFTREEFENELFETMSAIFPEDRVAVATSSKTLKKAKTSATLMYRIVTTKGSIRWIEDRKTSTFSPDGIYTGIDGILFDVTDRMMALEDKQQLESRLRKTQRLETIGTLAGGIAHDFNNILTPILGYAEMGVLSLSKGESLHEYFSEIMQAAERAQNLVSQILTFSRANESTPSVISVQSMINEALKLLRPSIPSTISIELQMEASCRNILADPSQIHQVIVNLCTNAFQAMEESGGILTIDLHETLIKHDMLKAFPKLQAGHYVQLNVSDSGHGMTESIMERIFEPFYTTKSVNKGTGLGLSVVHGIITSYRGEITVESTLGKGTTFRVYLPVINEKATHETSDEAPTGGTGKILIIDDEKAAIQMLSIMMTRLGFSVETECSPVRALSRFRQNPDHFDLVITDLTMPDMTGIELAKELHKTNNSLPVILMTGYGKDIELTIPLNNYGVHKILKKPVKLAQLAASVNELLSCNNQ